MKAVLDDVSKKKCKNDVDSIMESILSFNDDERNFLITLYREAGETRCIYINDEKLRTMSDKPNEMAKRHLRKYKSLGLITLEAEKQEKHVITSRSNYKTITRKYAFTDLFYELFQQSDGSIKIPKLKKVILNDKEMLLLNELYKNDPEHEEKIMITKNIIENTGASSSDITNSIIKFQKLKLIEYWRTVIEGYVRRKYKFTDQIYNFFEVTPTKLIRKQRILEYIVLKH